MNVFSKPLSPASATVVVLTAMVGYGFNPLFARWIYAFGLSPEISVVYRYGLPALLMLPFVTSFRNQSRESLMAFCGGLSMGLGALGYFKALSVLPVSVCVLFFLPILSSPSSLEEFSSGSEFKGPIWFQQFSSFAAVP